MKKWILKRTLIINALIVFFMAFALFITSCQQCYTCGIYAPNELLCIKGQDTIENNLELISSIYSSPPDPSYVDSVTNYYKYNGYQVIVDSGWYTEKASGNGVKAAVNSGWDCSAGGDDCEH